MTVIASVPCLGDSFQLSVQRRMSLLETDIGFELFHCQGPRMRSRTWTGQCPSTDGRRAHAAGTASVPGGAGEIPSSEFSLVELEPETPVIAWRNRDEAIARHERRQ
jgi:hypothetical protein